VSPKNLRGEKHQFCRFSDSRWWQCLKVVEDVVVKMFTFAISSPDEFLVTSMRPHVAANCVLCRQSSTTTGTRTAWRSWRRLRRRTRDTRRGRWRGSGANCPPTSLRGNTLSRTQPRRDRPLINTTAGTNCAVVDKSKTDLVESVERRWEFLPRHRRTEWPTHRARADTVSVKLVYKLKDTISTDFAHVQRKFT